MIQQKTALEKLRLAGIAALGLQGKQGGTVLSALWTIQVVFLKS